MGCVTVSGNSSSSLNSTRFTTPQATHTIHKALDLLKLWCISKKLMEKSIKDGKPWNYGLLQYQVTPISSTIPPSLEALTDRRPRTSLPQIPSSMGNSVESSRIQQELMKHQPVGTSTSTSMELNPGQPVFMKEVHGDVWKAGVIDQLAKEPDSYWIKFPDSSRLRARRGTFQNLFPQECPAISNQCSQDQSNQPYPQQSGYTTVE